VLGGVADVVVVVGGVAGLVEGVDVPELTVVCRPLVVAMICDEDAVLGESR
jgi:hypothetical protein